MIRFLLNDATAAANSALSSSFFVFFFFLLSPPFTLFEPKVFDQLINMKEATTIKTKQSLQCAN